VKSIEKENRDKVSRWESIMKKKGLLVVSFGTSHLNTLEKTIVQIEGKLTETFPEYTLYRAFTSKMIIKILKERDGMEIFTVAQALKQMVEDGISEVIVQPTHILHGVENDRMLEAIREMAQEFHSIKVGTPLLSSTEDYRKAVEEVAEEMDTGSAEKALVFMGHGTSHYTNSSYAALEYVFRDKGYEHVYVGTVEAYPSLETILPRLKVKGYKAVCLAPFMVVSGDHAANDMAGDEDSWKEMLLQEGFEVECILKGLGEYKGIQEIFAEHAREAISI
jgi:cobalamin biosynthesis Co2+ chelatase CbiK